MLRTTAAGVALALALALATSFAASPAPALTITVGNTDGANSLPFGQRSADWGGRYQQIYAASAFAGPVDIVALGFQAATAFNTPGAGPTQGGFELRLGTTGLAAYQLTAIRPNAGLPLVFSGPTPALNALEQLVFDLAAPFRYDPAAGSLLLDLRADGTSGAFLFCDADNSGSSTRRVLGNDRTSFVALTTAFAVPVPVSPALLGLAALRRRG